MEIVEILREASNQIYQNVKDLAGTEDAVLMIEGYCDFLTEEQIIAAIEEGHHTIKEICIKIGEWADLVGKEKKRDTLQPLSETVIAAADNVMKDELNTILRIKEKGARNDGLAALKEKVVADLLPEGNDTPDKPFTMNELQQAMKKSISNTDIKTSS